MFQTYINAFAQSYDPHTQYLSPDNAENFDINMSLSLEGIGAVLQSDNEHVKIVPGAGPGREEQAAVAGGQDHRRGPGQRRNGRRHRLAPGRSGQADPRAERLGGAEVIPASNAPNDQNSKVVAITREAVKLEEQAAKSVLNLEHQGQNFKLGVIEIPAFYLDFKALRAGDQNYKSTTRDVKKLLSELEAEKVDGVVIDLRNNGGGSLQEATELTGLFIDQGPTVLVRNSDGRVDVLADERSAPSTRVRWPSW